jgi:TRAP-type C4-dicarboxylate transport system substrate-binding protein
MVRTDEELDHLIASVGPVFESRLEEKGFKVMNWTSAGWVRFFTKTPVSTFDEMRKHKVIFWGDDNAYIEFLKKIGINPVPLAVTDMLPSLQTGLADAFAAPPTAALGFQWFGLAKNMIDLPWQPVPGTLVISSRTWKGIPEKQQEEMLKIAREAGVRLMKKSRELEQESIKVMQEHGLKVSTLTPETAEEWRKLMRVQGEPVWVGPRISREMFERVEKDLIQFRAEKKAEPGK